MAALVSLSCASISPVPQKFCFGKGTACYFDSMESKYLIALTRGISIQDFTTVETFASYSSVFF
jgi:hypothetical protein